MKLKELWEKISNALELNDYTTHTIIAMVVFILTTGICQLFTASVTLNLSLPPFMTIVFGARQDKTVSPTIEPPFDNDIFSVYWKVACVGGIAMLGWFSMNFM